MRVSNALVLVAMGLSYAAASGCKQNTVDVDEGGGGIGAQCTGSSGQGCGVAAVCVLGFCRSGCTTDAECPKGSLCVGDRAPYGCTLQTENACTSDAECAAGLRCGIDRHCRHGCSSEAECPRNEHSCIAGTCVSESESGAKDTWFRCAAGAHACTEVGLAPTPQIDIDPTGPPQQCDFPVEEVATANGGSIRYSFGGSCVSGPSHWVCNVLAPGWQPVGDCADLRACGLGAEASIASGSIVTCAGESPGGSGSIDGGL